MNQAEIQQKIISITSDVLGVPKERISQDSNFAELGADSLDQVALVIELEQTFNLEIPDNKAEKIDSVKQAMEYVTKQYN